MNEMKEAVGNWREAKQFSPADENDFLRWLDKADTEEKLFSRLTFWFTFRGLPADQNQRYHLVQERAGNCGSGTGWSSSSGAGRTAWPTSTSRSERRRSRPASARTTPITSTA